jgi:uncharacterized membrane protein YfcA
MRVAVATSLATIIATSLSSAWAHHQGGSVDRALLKHWLPFVAIGSIIGVVLAAVSSGAVMRGIFGSFLLAVACYMLFSREGAAHAKAMPSLLSQRGMAAGVGTLSSLVGIGGGAVAVPLLSFLGVPIRQAVGTSSAFGMIIAIPGTIGFIISGWWHTGLPPFSLGYVSLIGIAALLPTTALMAPFGAKVAHKVSHAFLRKIFALFLVLVSLKMLSTLITS